MAIQVKTPSQVAQEYLDELKALKPSVNVNQTDNDWWIRSRVVGSVISGVYADQRLLSDDPFPPRARRDALEKHLELYLERGFNPATQAQGNVGVTGDLGASISVGLQFTYAPNGNAYVSTEAVTLTSAIPGGASGVVPVQSVAAGQNQNLTDGAALSISSPPAGIQAAALVLGGLSDARDPETEAEAKDAVVTRIRQPLSVGRDSDYEQYAREADPAVVSASVSRYPFGLGTVGVYITSGTTDIDAAVDAGESVNIIPSDALVETVQEYLEENKPVTDCVTVFKPAAIPIDVTVKVRYRQGNGATILTGQTLTQDQLVEREVKRALYKHPVGGRVFDGEGFVVASEIEETIDAKLSADPVTVGSIPILLDRQVLDLSASGINRKVLPNEAMIPGTILIQSF